MSGIVTDLSHPSLAAANEANWREGWRTMFHRWERGEVHADPAATWYRSDLAHPLMNGVLAGRFGSGKVPGRAPVEATMAPEAEEQVSRMIARFRERGLPFWWWTFPSSTPANLGEILERQGLVREADLPGMGVDLALLPQPALPDGLTVAPVTSPEGLAQWAEAYERGFPMASPVAEAHREIFAQLGFGSDQGWRHFVGLDRGRPVASASVFLGAGVAGLYYVSVVPEGRGRGVGRALVLTALAEGRRLGCRAGILQSTAMGRPLYRRLGFQETITYPQYRWNGPLSDC